MRYFFWLSLFPDSGSFQSHNLIFQTFQSTPCPKGLQRYKLILFIQEKIQIKLKKIKKIKKIKT
jgi:hypothetical protein